MAKKQKSGGTPALDLVIKLGVEHAVYEYTHDEGAASYGLEAAEKLGVEPGRVFKTLIATTGTELVVAIVPVDKQLDLKALATALRAKSCVMADMALAERTTGYVAGGISPLGQKKRLRAVLDSSAEAFPTVNVSAGRRGLEIELSPADLRELTGAAQATIAR